MVFVLHMLCYEVCKKITPCSLCKVQTSFFPLFIMVPTPKRGLSVSSDTGEIEGIMDESLFCLAR